MTAASLSPLLLSVNTPYNHPIKSFTDKPVSNTRSDISSLKYTVLLCRKNLYSFISTIIHSEISLYTPISLWIYKLPKVPSVFRPLKHINFGIAPFLLFNIPCDKLPSSLLMNNSYTGRFIPFLISSARKKATFKMPLRIWQRKYIPSA